MVAFSRADKFSVRNTLTKLLLSVSQKARGFPAQSATSEIIYSSPERADFRALTIAGVLPRKLLRSLAAQTAAQLTYKSKSHSIKPRSLPRSLPQFQPGTGGFWRKTQFYFALVLRLSAGFPAWSDRQRSMRRISLDLCAGRLL